MANNETEKQNARGQTYKPTDHHVLIKAQPVSLSPRTPAGAHAFGLTPT